MKKYTFLVHHGMYDSFLSELQNLGVVHIIPREREEDELSSQQILVSTFEKALKTIRSRKQDPGEPGDALSGDEIVEALNNKEAERETLTQKLAILTKEKALLTPWGTFSHQRIAQLAEVGLHLRFFTCSIKRFAPEWAEQYNLEIISDTGTARYFVVVQQEDSELDIEAEELILPDRTLEEVQHAEQKLIQRRKELNTELDRFAADNEKILEDYLAEARQKLDFESALDNTQGEFDDRLLVLQGWVPDNRASKLEKFLDKHSVVYYRERAKPGEHVPVLLKNNRFNRLFEPIGNLFSLPHYNELDVTPFFAPFFTLFFGFCLGDAGYGLVILIATLIARTKVSDSAKPLLTLGHILGLSTMVIGTLTGTVFGMQLGKMEETASFIVIRDTAQLTADQQMFYLALSIGVLQVLFGMLLQVINQTRQFGIKYGLGTLGKLIGIISGTLWLLASKGIIPGTLGYVFMGLFFVGLFLVLFFNDPSKSVFAQFGLGFWVLYNLVTGIFGDVLSYVRLFALGISSAILGLVINQIGAHLGSIPYVGPVIFLVFLLVGHTGNILLSSLGAFVHPMRLTFVEFYKNIGFEGGGRAYKPFSAQQQS